jgi:hypothetical protein
MRDSQMANGSTAAIPIDGRRSGTTVDHGTAWPIMTNYPEFRGASGPRPGDEPDCACPSVVSNT